MRTGYKRAATAAAAACSWLYLTVEPAMAQLVESELDTDPGSFEVTQLVTSSTEVRRAVIGLLAIAAASGLLFFGYWYLTGQQARRRHAQLYGGRYSADTVRTPPQADWYDPRPLRGRPLPSRQPEHAFRSGPIQQPVHYPVAQTRAGHQPVASHQGYAHQAQPQQQHQFPRARTAPGSAVDPRLPGAQQHG